MAFCVSLRPNKHEFSTLLLMKLHHSANICLFTFSIVHFYNYIKNHSLYVFLLFFFHTSAMQKDQKHFTTCPRIMSIFCASLSDVKISNCYDIKQKLLNLSPHCVSTKFKQFLNVFKSVRKAITSDEEIIIFMTLIHLPCMDHLGNISPIVIRLWV